MTNVILIELSRLNKVNAEKREQLLKMFRMLQKEGRNNVLKSSIEKLTLEVKQIHKIQNNLWYIYSQITKKKMHV